MAALQKLVGEDTTIALIALYDRTVASGNIPLDPKANLIKLPPMERSDRGRVHQVIKNQCFISLLYFPILFLFANEKLGNSSHICVQDRN